MFNPEDFELHYSDDARSVHTLLRVVDEASGDVEEMLFDNLATVVAAVAENGWRIYEESFGFASSKGAGGDEPIAVSGVFVTTGAEILAGWREKVSGSSDEALVVCCYGDPAIVRAWTAS